MISTEDKKDQQRRLLAKAISNRARGACPWRCEPGKCKGFFSTGDALNMHISRFPSRCFEMRAAGWLMGPKKRRDGVNGAKGNTFWYHFIRKMPVQMDIDTGKRMDYIATADIDGKPIDFFELKAA